VRFELRLVALKRFQPTLVNFRDSGECPDVLSVSLKLLLVEFPRHQEAVQFLLVEFRRHHEGLQAFVDRHYSEISRNAGQRGYFAGARR